MFQSLSKYGFAGRESYADPIEIPKLVPKTDLLSSQKL